MAEGQKQRVESIRHRRQVIELTPVRNSHNLFSDILRWKNKIYTPAFYCALRHIRLRGCLELLRDVMPPTSFMPHKAAAPSPSKPETMTAISLPFQWCVRERGKTVITSGHPRGFDIGFRRNSPARTCKSRCAGMMNTWFGSTLKKVAHVLGYEVQVKFIPKKRSSVSAVSDSD
jgi:hypothetical protein